MRRLAILAMTTLAACHPQPQGSSMTIERISPDQIPACQDANQANPGEGIYYPDTNTYTCERHS